MDCSLPGFFCPWGFSRQEYWSGLPFPLPGALSTQRLNPDLPCSRQILYHLSHWRSPYIDNSSVAQLCPTLCDPMECSTPDLPVHPQLLQLIKPMSIESVMPSSHLILCRPLLLPPSIFPSIRVFSNESVLRIRSPKYWSFSFCISPSNEYSGLISFGIDWLDLLGVQGTLKSFPQHHGSKASILRCSAFFVVQLSHPYMTTGKTIALTRQT